MSAAENSIRADLEAAMKAHTEPEVEAEVVEASAEPVETETQKQERARDEKGRFAAKEVANGAGDGTAVRDTAQPPKPEAEGDAGVSATAAEAKSEAPSLAPPNGWPAEAKAKWHELPPEIMAAVQKREQDVAKFTSTRDEHASFGKELYQIASPYMAQIQAEGGTVQTAVKSLLNTAYVLRTGSPDAKRQMVMQIAQEYGVALPSAQAPADGKQGQQPDQYQALRAEIHELRNALTQREQTELQKLQTEVQTEIEAFAADPNHAHYQEVKAHMAALLREGAAKNLQDAYDQAVWARPDTRATLLAAQRAEEEQKRKSEAAARAAEARRKSIGITGGPGNTAAQSAPGARSLRQELEANFAASSGAV